MSNYLAFHLLINATQASLTCGNFADSRKTVLRGRYHRIIRTLTSGWFRKKASFTSFPTPVRGHYRIPTQTMHFEGQIPQNHHRFALFHSSNMGNLMIPTPVERRFFVSSVCFDSLLRIGRMWAASWSCENRRVVSLLCIRNVWLGLVSLFTHNSASDAN